MVEYAVVPPSKRASEDDRQTTAAKQKVMLYVAPEVHRAMRQVALDDGRSASDVYAEAARVFLDGRGLIIEARELHAAPRKRSDLAELTEAIDRQGRRIDDILSQVKGPHDGPRTVGGPTPAGTTAAAAVTALLSILTEAGHTGLTAREFNEAVQAAGVRSGTAEVAKAVLRAAGVVRCEGRRWYLGGP